MDNEVLDSQDKMTEIKTKQKLGLSIKLILSVVVLGAIAAGIYAAIALAR